MIINNLIGGTHVNFDRKCHSGLSTESHGAPNFHGFPHLHAIFFSAWGTDFKAQQSPCVSHPVTIQATSNSTWRFSVARRMFPRNPRSLPRHSGTPKVKNPWDEEGCWGSTSSILGLGWSGTGVILDAGRLQCQAWSLLPWIFSTASTSDHLLMRTRGLRDQGLQYMMVEARGSCGPS